MRGNQVWLPIVTENGKIARQANEFSRYIIIRTLKKKTKKTLLI